jgi:hypothetical protein
MWRTRGDFVTTPERNGTTPITALTIDGREVPIVIDPMLPNCRGLCEWNLTHEGYKTTPKRIVMRDRDERVLLHETLHCLLGDNEDIVRRATQLFELGWRLVAAPEETRRD